MSDEQKAAIRHAQNDTANINPETIASKEPSIAGAIASTLKDPNQYAVLGAEFRRGLKDLQDVVLNAFPQGHVAQHEEPGTIANPTQQVVTQEMGFDPGAFARNGDNNSREKGMSR
jgi:hypothetical protein